LSSGPGHTICISRAPWRLVAGIQVSQRVVQLVNCTAGHDHLGAVTVGVVAELIGVAAGQGNGINEVGVVVCKLKARHVFPL